MNFFQLLRMISPNTPLIVFDLNGIEISRVLTKDQLSIDLYNYDVFSINGITTCEIFNSEIHALNVTLIK